MRSEPVLTINQLNHAYDQNQVLTDINLGIAKGFVSLIGPNGSGKSTLIRLASGLLDVQYGDVQINGVYMQQLSPLQRARQFTVIQQKQFFPFPFSCLEMVAFGRYPFRKQLNNLDAEDYQIVIQAMQATDTLQFRDKKITDISGGEQQRVILASALAQQPQILFLDEAFSSMDISYQVQLIGLLKKMVQEQGLTVVSVVHDLNLAYRYSDSVCILNRGNITGFGHPHEVMTKESISTVFSVNVELVERRCFYIDI